MTEEQAVAVGARALARVLDLDPDAVRADTPLDSVGVDSLARVCLADAIEELAAAAGAVVRLDDAQVAAARTVGELARPLVTAGSPA